MSAIEPLVHTEIVLPADELRPYVSAYFVTRVQSEIAVEDHAVPEWGSMRIVLDGGFTLYRQGSEAEWLDGAYVQGPTTTSAKYGISDCQLLGIGILPKGFARLWDFRPDKIANDLGPLELLLGDQAAAFVQGLRAEPDMAARFALCDAMLLDRLDRTKPPKALERIDQINHLINDPEISRLEQLAEQSSLSPSTLSKFCRQRFGFYPKALLRRQRFLRMLDAMQARPYAEWKDYIDPQYVDQSHMIRDFKFFLGLSPSQYLALPRMVQQQSAEKRSAAIGGGLQGLS